MWTDHVEFIAWLRDYPRQLGFRSGEDLYNLFRLGIVEDDGDLWEWAQMWGYEVSVTAARAPIWEQMCATQPDMGEQWHNLMIRDPMPSPGTNYRPCDTAYDLAA